MEVFVLGAPGSGTELVGRFIASHPDCIDLGDFSGLYFSLRQAPQILSEESSPITIGYLNFLNARTREFIGSLKQKGKLICSYTPLNTLIAGELIEMFPSAIFVLVLRHFKGSVQNLRLMFAHGDTWAGSQLEESAELWARYYQVAKSLPTHRTIVISYDQLCCEPNTIIDHLVASIIERSQISTAEFDVSIFSEPLPYERSGVFTICERQPQPKTSYDASRWTTGMEAICKIYTSAVDDELRSLYPALYIEPL